METREMTCEEEIRALNLERHLEQRIISKHNKEIISAVDRENQKIRSRAECDLSSEMERMSVKYTKYNEQNLALKNACFALADALKNEQLC